ncbi:MAG: YiiX/YebB-like N1pC/P60 family cysteine hydrolase [Xenococcaceae cyanobacterium MO_207.B15]|nr:YiiX/YebB-like N1pC/P60 family cysteine hydrolase [Xenococcaceae cyanobacterium MO_207.B15]MDJ0745492.1 YiiX/YebB-like N1pC/P60 family cysteine hydrolase [Xenococcaceae cyanobacterium MO_167.B27]
MFLIVGLTFFYGEKLDRHSQTSSQYIETIDYSLLQSGDLIFRQGNGLLSQILSSKDQNSQFSHVGIVKIVRNRPFVIHASTGQPWGIDAVVKMDSLEDFLQKDLASAVAVYRLHQENTLLAENAANLAYQYSLKQIPFDPEFSLKSDDKFYCTELVWRVYLEVGIDLADSRFSQLSIPFGQEFYLLPSGLLSSRHLEQIYQLKSYN